MHCEFWCQKFLILHTLITNTLFIMTLWKWRILHALSQLVGFAGSISYGSSCWDLRKQGRQPHRQSCWLLSGSVCLISGRNCPRNGLSLTWHSRNYNTTSWSLQNILTMVGLRFTFLSLFHLMFLRCVRLTFFPVGQIPWHLTGSFHKLSGKWK